jgi:hypothetical protein
MRRKSRAALVPHCRRCTRDVLCIGDSLRCKRAPTDFLFTAGLLGSTPGMAATARLVCGALPSHRRVSFKGGPAVCVLFFTGGTSAPYSLLICCSLVGLDPRNSRDHAHLVCDALLAHRRVSSEGARMPCACYFSLVALTS